MDLLAVKVDYQTTFVVLKEKFEDFLQECRDCGQDEDQISRYEIKELDLGPLGWDEI